jgi:hypothetical protein
MDAFAVAQALLLDFESRIRTITLAANEPFLFHTAKGKENFTGIMTWTLKGFAKALRTVDAEAVEFHNSRGDFEPWAEHSLQDKVLSRQLQKARMAKLKGPALRRTIVSIAEKRFKELNKQAQNVTRLF